MIKNTPFSCFIPLSFFPSISSLEWKKKKKKKKQKKKQKKKKKKERKNRN